MHLDLATTSMLAGMVLNETPALQYLTGGGAPCLYRDKPLDAARTRLVSSEDCEISVDGGLTRARILRPSATGERHGLLPRRRLGNWQYR